MPGERVTLVWGRTSIVELVPFPSGPTVMVNQSVDSIILVRVNESESGKVYIDPFKPAEFSFLDSHFPIPVGEGNHR